MARPQDNAKRDLIINEARRLFAAQGFHHTSISDLTRATGLPVGTIYTYFPAKDDIMRTIVETGWEALHRRVAESFAAASGLEDRVALLGDFFFRELAADSDLINILLTEAVELTGINAKLDRLMELVTALQAEAGMPPAPAPAAAVDRAAVVVCFLGMLHALRLSPRGELGFRPADIQSFMTRLVRQSLG